MTEHSVTNHVPRPQAVELDWEDVMAGNFPTVDEQHLQAFQQAVVQAAGIMDRPEYNGRLQKAMDFVLGGHVTLHEDGTATVKSGSHTYHLEPECSCQDSQQRSMYCKHFLAVKLLKRTYERFNSPENGLRNPEAPQASAPQPQAWECAQAPSSCTLKWAINGIELMLTLRAADDHTLFNRIGRVLPRIEEKVEAHRQAKQQERQQQAGGGSSNGQNPIAKPEEDPDPYCHYHQVPLRRYTKDGRSWYSHFDDETQSWCRGK